MASAPRDANRVPALTATSSVDGVSAVLVYADPTTNRLLVNTSGSSFSDSETPTGAMNGSNVTFTLAHSPSPVGSLILMVGNQVLAPVGVDFTLSGSTITLNTAPPTGTTIICWYRY